MLYDGRFGGQQSASCHPPSVRLQIEFDLQFGTPFPEKYQEDEQHQKVHKAAPPFYSVECADPAPNAGFCMCTEHIRQLGGESPLDNMMEVKS